MKLIKKKIKFRVQGMFFNNCIEKNQNKTHFEEGMHDEVSLIEVNLFLGTGHATKSDEFLEEFQMAFDPP